MNWDLLSLLKQLVKDSRINVSSSELEKSFDEPSSHNTFQKPIFHIIGKIIQSSGNAEIGMSVGKYINPNSFHGLGYLFMTADNLLMACQRVSEFPALYQNLVRVEVQSNNTHMYFRVNNIAGDQLTQSIINEATLAIIYQYTNWLSREVIDVCEVKLAHSPISASSSYLKYFHRQPEFNSNSCQLIFPISTALAPLLTTEPEYHLALYSKLQEKQEQMSKSFLSKARSAIRTSLQLGNVSRFRIASELSLSEKTLERRLNEHNFSYRELIDAIRLELAQKYLSQTEYTIDDIARNLGYCDRTSFSKAYKKWTGQTPGLHRQHFRGRE